MRINLAGPNKSKAMQSQPGQVLSPSLSFSLYLPLSALGNPVCHCNHSKLSMTMMMNCKIERWQLQRDTVWIDSQTAGWTDGRTREWLTGWLDWLAAWIDASAYSIRMWHKAAAARQQQPQCQCMWHNFKYAAPEILLHWLHASTSRARTRCDATDSADSRLELLRCLAELDDSLICWQLAYNWRLMDGVLHCQDILRAASAQFLYFLRSLSSALFAHFAACLQYYFNYFRNQYRVDKV